MGILRWMAGTASVKACSGFPWCCDECAAPLPSKGNGTLRPKSVLNRISEEVASVGRRRKSLHGNLGVVNTEPRRFKLGDLEIEAINDLETMVIEGEIDDYFSEGIVLRPGDCVIDAGANFGAFSAAAFHRLSGDLRILAFEPVPSTFEVLARNLANHFEGTATAFPFGLGSCEDEVDALHFPAMTTLSSVHPELEDAEAKRERVGRAVKQMIREGRIFSYLRALPPEVVESIVDGQVGYIARPRPFRARIRPLSRFLDDCAVEEVGLLKVDVEGAELEVLRGIEPHHWPNIRQVVAEVEQYVTREPEFRAILVTQGFEVISRQDTVQAAGNYGMVYARR